MMYLFLSIAIFLSSIIGAEDIPPPHEKRSHTLDPSKSIIEGKLTGQLGNQCFEIAALTALALRNNAQVIFSDLVKSKRFDIPENYDYIFFRCSTETPKKNYPFKNKYRYLNLDYAPIPFYPNTHYRGFFQSEKYFIDYKEEILNLFEPDPQLIAYLKKKHSFLKEKRPIVALHVRTYWPEKFEQSELPSIMNSLPDTYYKKATQYFPEDALFVVFSDNMTKARKLLSGIKKDMIFIENQPHYLDFLLISLCDHAIISNSTFSWWGSYLNKNPDKIIVAPKHWFKESYEKENQDIIAEGWLVI